MTTGIVQTESRHAGSFMVSEAPGRLSRDRFVVALSQTLVAGQVVGKIGVAVAATFNSQIKFVIADGSNDFAIGDAFSVTVGIEETDYQIAAYNPAGADGTQRVAGILWEGVTTDGANLGAGVVIARAAEVRGVDLTWPAGITAVQKADAIRQLEKLGIIVR